MSAIAGGALIALSLSLMLVGTGRIAGLSGLLAGVLRGTPGDTAWRVYFIAGMFISGIAFRIARPSTFDYAARVPLWAVALGGVAVAVGVRASNGCTSGHGLCGMSRLSRRSIVATVVFVATGIVTATLIGSALRST